MKQAHRFSGKGQPYEGLTVVGKHGPRWVGRARFVPEMLDAPLKWRKPRRVFVNSMSDLFHGDITDGQIASIFGVMAACPRHTFQVLTKRPERALRWYEWIDGLGLAPDGKARERGTKHIGGDEHPWPLPNVWLGTSCENQKELRSRVPLLRWCPAAVHFLSCEPLLEGLELGNAIEWTPIGPDADGVSSLLPPVGWVIVGGESGPGARPCDIEWVRSIVRQCKDAGVACFVKQLGARPAKELGGMLLWNPPTLDRKGGNIAEFPEDLRIREFPRTT